MERLSAAELRAGLTFVEDAWALAGETPFVPETIDALRDLIPCDDAGYFELDRLERRFLDCVTEIADSDEEADAFFWEILDEHPLCRHQLAYADFSARRLSDVISRRRLRASRVYAEWFRPWSVEAELEAGISTSRTCTRNFVLSRGDGDFSERDRAMLELVRPHLARIREMSELRRATGDTAEDLDRLTTREREVLELVGAGLTNAGIAERLWISPATVKKHLENIYAKLGVANRTQAASRSRTGRRT